MIWLHSVLLLNYYIIYQHVSIFFKLQRLVIQCIILKFYLSNVSKKKTYAETHISLLFLQISKLGSLPDPENSDKIAWLVFEI